MNTFPFVQHPPTNLPTVHFPPHICLWVIPPPQECNKRELEEKKKSRGKEDKGGRGGGPFPLGLNMDASKSVRQAMEPLCNLAHRLKQLCRPPLGTAAPAGQTASLDHWAWAKEGLDLLLHLGAISEREKGSAAALTGTTPPSHHQTHRVGVGADAAAIRRAGPPRTTKRPAPAPAG
jgi:hypothetical protein